MSDGGRECESRGISESRHEMVVFRVSLKAHLKARLRVRLSTSATAKYAMRLGELVRCFNSFLLRVVVM